MLLAVYLEKSLRIQVYRGYYTSTGPAGRGRPCSTHEYATAHNRGLAAATS